MELGPPQEEEEKLEPTQEDGTRTPDDHVAEDPPLPEKTEADQTAPDVPDPTKEDAKGTGSA
eukprot:3500118-Pyramimonas_sp.AAC.1